MFLRICQALIWKSGGNQPEIDKKREKCGVEPQKKQRISADAPDPLLV